jgi:cell division protein FtsQ
LKARSKTLSWYIIWGIIAAVILSIFSGFVFSLPIWQLKEVIINGNKYFTEEKIINIAKLPSGENIFLIDPDEIKARFSNIIQIKELRVSRKLPNKIVIDIIERKPFAIAVIDNLTTLIDDEGFIISKQNLASSIYRLDIAKYPVVRGISRKNLEKGIQLFSNDREFMSSAINLMSNFMDIGSIQIDLANKDDIVIYIEDIIKVKIGNTNDIERKIKIVNVLLGKITGKWEKVSYIDVRVPDNPVIRFK